MKFIFFFISFFVCLPLLKPINIIQNNTQKINFMDENNLNTFLKNKTLRKIQKKEKIINDADKYIDFLSRNKKNKNNEIIADILINENEILNKQDNFEPIENIKNQNELNEEDLVKEYFRKIILNNENNQKTKKIDKGLLFVVIGSVAAIWIKLFLLDQSSEKHTEDLVEMEKWIKQREEYISEMKEKIKVLNDQHKEMLNVYEKLLAYQETRPAFS